MITISAEDVTKLVDLFGGNKWTSAQLEMILRKFDGNLDRACNRVLQHGDQDPRLLMRSLGITMGTEAQPTPTPKNSREAEGIVWCWKETPGQMYHHAANEIVGDPSDCWIRFSLYQSQELEISYQLQEGSCEVAAGHHSNGTDSYRIDFRTMQQTNLRTGYHRHIQRLENGANTAADGSRPRGSPGMETTAASQEPSPMAVATPIFPSTTPTTQQTSTSVPIASAQLLPRPAATNMQPTPVAQNMTPTTSPTPTHPRTPTYPLQQLQQPPQASPPLPFFIAQRAFVGDQAQGQLQFQAGAQVFILPVPETNGWRMGRVQNQQGWFPVPFLPPANGAQANHQTGVVPAQQPEPQPSRTSTADILKLYGESKAQETLSMPQQRLQQQSQSIQSVGAQVAVGCPAVANEMNPTSLGANIVPPNPPSHPMPVFATAGVTQQQFNALPAKQTVSSMPAVISNAETITAAEEGTANKGDVESKERQPEEALSNLERQLNELEQQRKSLEPNVLTELVTQVCCQLDGVDVGGSSPLRQKRKTLIRKAETLDSMDDDDVDVDNKIGKAHASPVQTADVVSAQAAFTATNQPTNHRQHEQMNAQMTPKATNITASDIMNLYSTPPAFVPSKMKESDTKDLLHMQSAASTQPSPISREFEVSVQQAPPAGPLTLNGLVPMTQQELGVPALGNTSNILASTGRAHHSPRHDHRAATTVIAKYAFLGDPSLHQLSFPVGAHLAASTENANSPNGWSHGRYLKQKGWFPTSYVELPHQAPQVSKAEMHNAHTRSDMIPTAPMPPLPPPPVPPQSGLVIPGPDEVESLAVESDVEVTKPKNKSKNAARTKKKKKIVSEQKYEPTRIPFSSMPDYQLGLQFNDDVSVVPHEFEVMGGNAADSTLWTPAPNIIVPSTNPVANISASEPKNQARRKKKSSLKSKVESSTSSEVPMTKPKNHKNNKVKVAAAPVSSKDGDVKKSKTKKKRDKSKQAAQRKSAVSEVEVRNFLARP